MTLNQRQEERHFNGLKPLIRWSRVFGQWSCFVKPIESFNSIGFGKTPIEAYNNWRFWCYGEVI
jgi:hypothetical protein